MENSKQQFSEEFFLQRSFEVVWAIFRVSEHVTRPKIKEGLEERAAEYLLYKHVSSLSGLEEMVRLAMHIKEINNTNGQVLLREITNLKSMLSDIEQELTNLIESGKTPENAPNIEDIFAKPPMLLSDFMKLLKRTQAEDIPPEIEQNKDEAGKKEEIQESPAKHESLAKSGKEEKSGKTEELCPTSRRMGARERRESIFEIVKRRNLCHIKDVLMEMPHASDRTIRYDIRQMVDKGVLERVGSGGPNSFFRLKKTDR